LKLYFSAQNRKRMAENESGERLCLICRSKSDCTHFGVDSCRACAAFFRRSVSLNKTYKCRAKTDLCDVSKDAKLMCRGCRYTRCIEAGMLPKNVHSKFDTRAKDDSMGSDDEPAKSVSRNSDSEAFSEYLPSRPSVISNVLHAMPATTPLLTQLSDQYRILLAVRRSCELLLWTQSQSADPKIATEPINPDRVFPATIGHHGKSVRGTQQAFLDFATSCFPVMETFNQHEKSTLLKTFRTCTFVFEAVYRVRKLMPGNSKVVMITSMSYLDMDNLDHYLSDADDIHNPVHVNNVSRDLTMQSMLHWLAPLLDRAKITHVEATAIIGLLFWPNYIVKASKRVIDISFDYQQRIFGELQTYYKDVLRLDDHSSRIAHVTCILVCVQGIMQRLKDDMEIYRILNDFDSNDDDLDVVGP
ncbi:hypothetical protein PENTCL1PPCAC_3133, partial [Pristionchus entomophagus]